MKTNKKGMTLVECIIAMAVFAVATTGFTMAATVCMKAQARTVRRMTATNNQTTNLEHLSTYSKVLDPEYSNVKKMETGTNKFTITFPFESGDIVNNHVYGYKSKLDEDSPDGVFELSFFSPAEQVSLDSHEYWVTLYNCSTEQKQWNITCTVPGDLQEFEFFNNEKDPSAGQALPTHIWAPNGGYMRFGIRQKTAGVGDINNCLVITDDEGNSSAPIKITDMCINEGENYCAIYYYPGHGENPFLSPREYDAADEGTEE